MFLLALFGLCENSVPAFFSQISYLFFIAIVVPVHERLAEMNAVGLQVILVSRGIGFQAFPGIVFSFIFPLSVALLFLEGDRVYYLITRVIVRIPERIIVSVDDSPMRPASVFPALSISGFRAKAEQYHSDKGQSHNHSFSFIESHTCFSPVNFLNDFSRFLRCKC